MKISNHLVEKIIWNSIEIEDSKIVPPLDIQYISSSQYNDDDGDYGQ